jgi:hypothetical protein
MVLGECHLIQPASESRPQDTDWFRRTFDGHPRHGVHLVGPGPRVDRGLPSSQLEPDYTVRRASVGDMRDARSAGYRPARAPITSAVAIPAPRYRAGRITPQPRMRA